ncbi:universal stress protein [Rhodoferax lacus]|uniref:Universal stress protein n=1 Tax=Rhodoferax lacus TaxID=2184758 RepID=A0A3E1RCV6_9BURK|nr:universal stress protein [Rhodoferax lacus]RFO97189.1 universal stress protein [Rhodoferax lacus]
MYKKIFVAIDNSSTARKALDEAIALGGALKASICVTFVADESGLMQHGMGLGSYIDVDKIKAEIRTGANAMLDEAVARATAAGCQAERLLIESANRRVAEAIADAAQGWGADLLVIGAHGVRGFERLLVGSVAENLTRISLMSLLIVRQP